MNHAFSPVRRLSIFKIWPDEIPLFLRLIDRRGLYAKFIPEIKFLPEKSKKVIPAAGKFNFSRVKIKISDQISNRF